MSSAERDVIIVGAGPAGSICAAYLAKAGVDVLLLEKDIFPKDKACGDMLCEGMVYHMGALGSVRRLDAMSTCVRNLKLIGNGDREAVIPFECYCTQRYKLDELLVQTAMRHGAELRQGCTVTDVIKERGRVTGVKVKFRGEESQIRSKIVIGADGAFSVMAEAIGITKEKTYGMWMGERAYFKGIKLDETLAKHQYDAYGVFGFSDSMSPGYFWVLPVGRDGVKQGICNVGMIVHDGETYNNDDLQKRFSEWVEGSPKISAMFEGAERISPWKGGRINDVSHGIQKAGNGFMMIGDAAALTMPMSHDGLSVVADSAKAAANAAEEALAASDFSEEKLTMEYSRAFKDKDEQTVIEELKQIRLRMESMHDPRVMDKTIDLLGKDPVFRRKFLK